jgi:hypothetical protein
VNDGEIIELRAVDPDGDIACDFTIANEGARDGLAADLASGMAGPARRIDGGVEAPFHASAKDAVMRYVQLESQCCSFLTLSVQQQGDIVLLRVTGREDAQPLIEQLFTGRAPTGRGEDHFDE